MPFTYGRPGAPEDNVPARGPAHRARPAFSAETFRPAERKPSVSMKSFHGMQSFHVVAGRRRRGAPRAGNAGGREPEAWGRAAAASKRHFARTPLFYEVTHVIAAYKRDGVLLLLTKE